MVKVKKPRQPKPLKVKLNQQKQGSKAQKYQAWKHLAHDKGS